MKKRKEIRQTVSVILWTVAVLSCALGAAVYAIFGSIYFMAHCFLISFIAAVTAVPFTSVKTGGGLPGPVRRALGNPF